MDICMGLLGVVLHILFRGTAVWLGTLLIDLPALGLPAITWLQSLGIMLAFRSLITYGIDVRQAQPREH